MSWPWWVTRKDAGYLAMAWIGTLVLAAVLGVLEPDLIQGMLLGTAGFVAICWRFNPRPEADQEPTGESREITVEDAT